MNFKTTLVLIGLLAVAGIVLLFTRDKGGGADGSAGDTAVKNEQKLFDVAESDVNKLSITQADGKKMTLEKSGAKWRMTEPVAAEAEAFEADALVRAIVNLNSQGTTDAQSTGLAKPAHTVELSTTGGKSYTLAVGDKTAVGENLYVSRKDDGKTHVVGAELVERLEKQASDYRSKKLVEMSTNDVTRIEINKAGSGGGRVVLAKAGGDWKVTEPQQFPAEKADVDNILFDLTGLRANEFVSENAAADAALYDLAQPRITATLTTGKAELPVGVAAPATAPSSQATSQPAPLVIKFGRYDDVMKKNVFVSTSASPVVAAVGVNVLEALNKKPIELRDRKVFDAEPEQASSITISSDLTATTQPTSRPASKKEVFLRRTKPAAATAPAVPAPATQSAASQPAATQATSQPATQVAAATQPAATQPAATQPAATQPATKWEIVASPSEAKPADDAKVDSLLGQLHPLRAQKYLETAPTTQPTATYIVKLTTAGPGGTPVNNYELKLVDPGDSKPLVGTYNGLAFEVDRLIVDRISGDFVKGATPPPGGGFANEGLPFPTGP